VDSDSPEVESTEDKGESPAALQLQWELEIAAAKKNLEQFHQDGDKVIAEYLGEGGSNRLNLFYADVLTKSASLSGEPKIRAKRRYSDANDDVARISADILERLLNTDVERDSDGFRRALRNARGDWMKPALGQIRFRYVVEEAEEACPSCAASEVPESCPDCEGKGTRSVKAFEDVETDYVHWRDFLWSPCRTWDEVRWNAYRVEMSRDALVERFGDVGAQIPLNAKDSSKTEDGRTADPLKRASVWEVWDKETLTRLFFVEGWTEVLEVSPDPLGLPNFFPSPEPLAANLTTSKFMPRSFYFLAEDLYRQAHELTARIRDLVKAIKVVGAYAKGNDAIKRILDEACDNEMVAVSDLSMLVSEDGIKNPAWFMPIEPQLKAVIALVEQRTLIRSDIAEVLGLSDIMRGQQMARATATTDRIKARAFSMRSQVDQDEYARFATDAQRIRAHIIAKHFDPKTLIERSNMEATLPGLKSQNPAEAQAAQMQLQQAVQLLKDDVSAYRIDVDSESLSMTDMDAVQQDSMAFMTATSEFFQRWTPLMQVGGPPIAKFALELYQQFAAQLRGAQRFESIIDRAVAELEQAANAPKPPPQPDPKVEAEKMRAQAEMGKAQADMQQTSMDTQAHAATTQMDMVTKRQEFGMKMAELAAKRAVVSDFAVPRGVE